MDQRKSRFIQELARSVSCVDEKYRARLPENYLAIQAGFIKNETAWERISVTTFHGGPLNYRAQGISDAWLTPVCFMEQQDDDGLLMANYHVISINCDRGMDFRRARLYFSLATDDELKLSSREPEAEALRRAIAGNRGQKTVIIRYSPIGSLAFPLMSFPNTTGERIGLTDQVNARFVHDGFMAVLHQFHLGGTPKKLCARIKSFLKKTQLNLSGEIFPGTNATDEERLETEHGTVYITNFVSRNTVWGLYRVYSLKPLAKIDRRGWVLVRIDSGCDIGMLYNDAGCDCRSQLLSALQPADGSDAVVIHIPHQDGRGYGCNSKSHTEGLKNGINPITREKLESMMTEDAAVYTFGPSYDIRSYREAAEIIAALRFGKIGMITDNSRKVWVMKKVLGEDNVHQIGTDTISQLIRDKTDPQTVIQMARKLSNESNYSLEDIHKTLMSVLEYIGCTGVGKNIDVEMMKKILEKQHQALLEDYRMTSLV